MTKKLLVLGGLAMMAVSCSDSAEEDINLENEINQEEIIEMESATEEVDEGLIHLEEDATEITNEIDSLLNDI